MISSGFQLYHYWRSSCSWRVRWALFHKGISFEAIPVNLLEGEAEGEEHKKRNPAGFVPALKTPEGHFLTESLAIISYLDESFPSASLLPGSALDRARIWALAESINAGTQPLQNIPVMDRHSSDPEEKKQWSRHWIQNGLQIFEALASDGSANYSHGNILSLADLCLIPQCYNAERFGVDFRKFSIISRIYDNCMKLKSLQNSHPDQYKPLNP